MYERTCLVNRLWWCPRGIAMDEAVAGIAFEALGLEINAPHAKLGGIERKLQPIATVMDGGLIAPPLGKECGKDQYASGNGKQGCTCSIGAIVQALGPIQGDQPKRGRPDDREAKDQRSRSGKYWPTMRRQEHR